MVGRSPDQRGWVAINPPRLEPQLVTLTPGLTLLGVLLVLVSIPLAFSLGPLALGVDRPRRSGRVGRIARWPSAA